MRQNRPFKINTLHIAHCTLHSARALSGLQRTLLLFVVLPLVLLTALGIRFGLNQANQYQEQRLKNDLELIGHAVSILIGNAVNNGDRAAMELALRSVFVQSEFNARQQRNIKDFTDEAQGYCSTMTFRVMCEN